MNPAELTATIAALGTVVGALTGYLVKALEIKRTAQAQDKAAQVQEEATAVEGYDRLTRALQARLEAVEQKLYQAEKRITELECENKLLRDQVSTLKLSIGN